jgi:cystathionine gamma-synthase
LNKLQQLLSSKQKDFCALFTEVPSNPLLQTPNVSRLRDLATEHKFSFVVDDTIGNFLNVNLLGEQGADVLCTSLTKLFSGRGDAMAGSLVVNPETDVGQQMQSDLVKYHDQTPGLFSADAWALYHNAHDFEERNDVINETAEQLADWLKEHESVAKVWYPKYTSLYSQVATGRGYGGLLSLHLQSHICQRTFFDALDVSKGPSLGTNFTLACPYTLLAHYHELDFAMEYNVMPNLLRVAIGLEPFEVLKDRFESAFDKSRLHPPLPKQSQRQRRMYSTNAVKQGLALTKRLVR